MSKYIYLPHTNYNVEKTQGMQFNVRVVFFLNRGVAFNPLYYKVFDCYIVL